MTNPTLDVSKPHYLKTGVFSARDRLPEGTRVTVSRPITDVYMEFGHIARTAVYYDAVDANGVLIRKINASKFEPA